MAREYELQYLRSLITKDFSSLLEAFESGGKEIIEYLGRFDLQCVVREKSPISESLIGRRLTVAQDEKLREERKSFYWRDLDHDEWQDKNFCNNQGKVIRLFEIMDENIGYNEIINIIEGFQDYTGQNIEDLASQYSINLDYFNNLYSVVNKNKARVEAGYVSDQGISDGGSAGSSDKENRKQESLALGIAYTKSSVQEGVQIIGSLQV